MMDISLGDLDSLWAPSNNPSAVEACIAPDVDHQPALEPPISYLDDCPISSIEEATSVGAPHEPSAFREEPFDLEAITHACDHAAPFDGVELQIRSANGERLTSKDEDFTPDLHTANTAQGKPVVVEIPVSTLIQPRSLYQGFVPPATQVREREAIAALLEAAESRQPAQEDHIEFDLEDFSIYVNSEYYPYELRPLHHLAVRQASDRFYFDGVVVHGDDRFYLNRIPFRQIPIGNYGSEEHTVGEHIWIRSELNEREGTELYYKLRSPSTEYSRFYEPFLWIADLAKHVIDFCDHLKDRGHRAVLHDFRSHFGVWLLQTHSQSAAFQRWYAANRSDDFRGALVANIEFIWKEANGLDPGNARYHTIWKEAKSLDMYQPNLTSSPKALVRDDELAHAKLSRYQNRGEVSPTIVTPYAYGLFSHMVFGNVLKRVKPSAAIHKKQAAFMQGKRPIQQSSPPAVKRDSHDRDALIASIRAGDVISTKPDDKETGTEWTQGKSKHHQGHYVWFGLVQEVHKSPRGSLSFDVIWLYQSVDTPCGMMKYPWKNELFLSDNCTCHHDTGRVHAEQILKTHSVEWFGSPSTKAEFFVRQTYLADDCRWTSLKKEHLTCTGQKFGEEQAYRVGDAVLVETKPRALLLENFIIEAFFDEDEKRYVRLRRLLRRKAVDKSAPNSPSNELVYTDQFVEISARRIFRRCLVRAFQPGEKITTAYDCDGTGNAFFMTHQEVINEDGEVIYAPLDISRLHQLRQGFDPSRAEHLQKLQGLDLFCGGGNFGRGLEDGGAIEMRWANDIWSKAIHTYMANCEPGACTPFLGSVDDLLLHAMKGDHSKVPQPGDVDFISAGSPCPGFSLLTVDKTTDKQRKNQSLVASFASFVDLYRPSYGLLENVPQMVNTKKARDACVFSQLVCALVGLGYQTQVMFLDAWSFGAPQSRSRVFLCFTAPGFRMPRVPAPSHSHPPGVRFNKLGEMSCGRPFDSRELVSTPFQYVSSSEATADLPNIQDGKPDYCVGFPDHRVCVGFTSLLRNQIWHIPTLPWGLGFSKAWYGRPALPRSLSESDRLLYPPEPSSRVKRPSKGWSRVRPDGLFSTVSTTCVPTDSRMGTVNHWSQHRPISVLEARRAQGFRDHEVLVGAPPVQWHIVGNSVARQVSIALGLAIREAWFGTLLDEPAAAPETRSATEAFSTSGSAVAAADATAAIRVDSSSPDTSSEDRVFAATAYPSTSLTPATSESVGASDCEGSRKRLLEIYVEVAAKRSRPSPGPNLGLEGGR
ncbi:S-adenosyl-L-methionine-dependent methyltransferase [Durotheca rogersii]|uniref:S-adenosyl-L-methionine-dependent methyltransferase n=1 Tax=Durotheca rogersii TaxID=419775 RepID=UPI00221EDF2E|nr:S-adenosyl-L-methionine-dependent methyltransferase [Durotheca rogersii]KAI5863960.1 S-adenosyl-L-methionine-dependent methyltransferase [Durotheca rogersii]